MLCIHVEFGWRTMREHTIDGAHDCKKRNEKKRRDHYTTNNNNFYRCKMFWAGSNCKVHRHMNEYVQETCRKFANSVYWSGHFWLYLHLIIILNFITSNTTILWKVLIFWFQFGKKSNKSQFISQWHYRNWNWCLNI